MVDIQIAHVPLECSMFDIADNVLEIPFVKCAHPRYVKYF